MKRNQKESKRKFFGIISGMTEKTTANDRKNDLRFLRIGEWIPRKIPDFPCIFLDFPCIFPEISIKFLIFASFFILIE